LFESFKIKDYLPADSENSSGFFFQARTRKRFHMMSPNACEQSNEIFKKVQAFF